MRVVAGLVLLVGLIVGAAFWMDRGKSVETTAGDAGALLLLPVRTVDVGHNVDGAPDPSTEHYGEHPVESLTPSELLEPVFVVHIVATQAPATRQAAATAAPVARIPLAATRIELGVVAAKNTGHELLARDVGEPLRSVMTDSEGRATAAVPRRVVEALGEVEFPAIWARPLVQGYLPRPTLVAVPQEVTSLPIQLTIVGRPGLVVEGILLGPHGEPVGGQVDLRLFTDGGTSIFSGKSDDEGRFRISLTQEGKYGCFAEGTSDTRRLHSNYGDGPVFDLGTGTSGYYEIRFDEAPPFIEVVVSGPGVLRGRLVDADGAPAASVSLEAVRVPTPGADFFSTGGGHTWAMTTTDGNGAFEFPGLQDDLYHVQTCFLDPLQEDYIQLTDEPFPAHGEPFEVQLTRPYLAIHVLQADGSPVQDFVRWYLTRYGRETAGAWPEEPELYVCLSAESAQATGQLDPRLKIRPIGQGEFVVDVPVDVGVDIDVGLRGGALPWAPQRVHVPAGARRVDVELREPEEQAGGILVLDVLDASDNPAAGELRVSVMDAEGGAPFVERSWPFGGVELGPRRCRLPVGDFVLLVEGHSRTESMHGTVMEFRRHGAFETALSILPGAETRIVARLGSGARLHLRAQGTVPDEYRKALRANWAAEGVVGSTPEAFESLVAKVDLRLERAGRVPSSIPFRCRGGWGGFSTSLCTTMTLGSEVTSELLTPGDYTLVATVADGRVVRLPVSLVAGQTADVTLVFD